MQENKDGKITKMTDVLGQRYIACGASDGSYVLHGTPGNALGAYLDGAEIELFGNAQDELGDTMNDGRIIVHGSCGDTAAYAMRGGEIYIQGDAGYRAGIHMKAYAEKSPVLVIGGSTGSFLGEYLAGGTIIVLGLNSDKIPTGDFCAAGMYGGSIYLRGAALPNDIPDKIKTERATLGDMALIEKYINTYCEVFACDKNKIYDKGFFKLTADSQRPYKQLYVTN